MAEKDTQLKNDLAALLTSNGFEVIPIEASDEDTPDFAASDGEIAYLIEIKQKFQRTLEAKEIETNIRLDKVGRYNRLSGITKKAVKQLRARQKDKTVNLMWFFGEYPDQNFQYDQLRATVYGMRLVVGTQKGAGVAKYGYYITHSDFYRWREVLDGVALGNLAGFFLNDLSPRYTLTKNSRLVKLFGNAVDDPIARDELGDIYRVDGDIDPDDCSTVKRFLDKKYEIKVIEFTELTRFSTEL